MKAIFFEQHGEIDALKYADLPNPEPRPGEALIKVKAVAINHLDVWVRRGWKGLKLEMPHIGGSDISGEIVTVNAPSGLTAGTKVIVNPGIVTAEDEWTRRGEESLSPGYRIVGENVRGGMAEFVTVPLANVFKLPEGIDFPEAAAPLLVGTTCWRMLFKRAKLKIGDSVLIVGAGGGVNSLCVLLAKAAGATVYVLAGSEEKSEKARALGADVVLNYRETPQWHMEVLKHTKMRGVDVVVDNVGSATIAKSLSAVTRGGCIVSVGNTSGFNVSFDNRLLFTKQVSIIGSTMGSRQDFIDAMQFLWNRKIKIPIDRIEPLSEGIKMIQYLEQGRQFGKIVLVP